MKKLYLLFLFINFLNLFYVEESFSINLAKEQYKMSDLINNFKQYKTTNTNFHSGDLFEHSAWVAKTIEYWFTQKETWTQNLTEQDKKIALFAGLLHDVGKAGDLNFVYYSKPTHPRDGFEYLIGKKHFQTNISEYFNFNKFFKSLNLTEIERKEIAIIIGMHHEFGEFVLKNLSLKDYKKNLKNVFNEYVKKIKELAITADYKNKIDPKLIRLSILVSAADVKGTKPIDFHSNFLENLEIKDSEIISKYNPKNSAYEKFDYEKTGKKIKEEFETLLKDSKNLNLD